MEKTYIKLFRDQKVLQEMLELVKNGKSIRSIATLYECDRSTIIYHIKKSHITRQILPKIGRPKSYPQDGKLFKLKDYYVDAFTKEKINTGLPDYKSYTKVEEERKWKEFINKPTRTRRAG